MVVWIVVVECWVRAVVGARAPPISVVITLDAHSLLVTLEAALCALELAVVVRIKRVAVIAVGTGLGHSSRSIGHVCTNTILEYTLVDVQNAVTLSVSHFSVQAVRASELLYPIDLRKLAKILVSSYSGKVTSITVYRSNCHARVRVIQSVPMLADGASSRRLGSWRNRGDLYLMEAETYFVPNWSDTVVVVVHPKVLALHAALIAAGLALQTFALTPLKRRRGSERKA